MAKMRYGCICLLLAITGLTGIAQWSRASDLEAVTRSVWMQKKLIQQARALEVSRKQQLRRQELSTATESWKIENSYRNQPAYSLQLYEDPINAASREYGLSPALIKAVIHVESGFNRNAVSSKGAIGLMQIMPGTAREIGVYNLYDPHENIMGGTRLLRVYIQRYGSVKKALICYNAGESYIAGNKPLPKETREYVPKVLRFFRYYSTNHEEESR